MIVTTNLPFESWTEVRLRAAHRGHARPAHASLPDHRDKDESYRLQDAKARTNRSAKSANETVDETPASS